jgi:hypothetical protein
LTVGAVQFASGHDLTAGLLATNSTSVSVNRSAKADRVQAFPSAGQTKTIALRLSQFDDTSFLLRIPAAPARTDAVRGAGKAPAATQPLIESNGAKRDGLKRQVACEPSVSILTEVAKTLQPGRCVT